MTSPNSYEHKHAIIGAGFCGLGMAAAMKRHGIPFDVFEADDEVGGNWYHGVYENVHIISSRRTTEYKDFPMPADWPDFPSAGQMLSYLKSYAEHHGLRPHIAFRTAVARVAPASTSSGDDRWEVTLASGERRVYGGVVVANGHHWDRRMPRYPGTFAGQMMHSKDYKTPDLLVGKRVLVIGGGNSACDIAVEAARFAATAHISLRRGYWFLPKTVMGKPLAEFMQPWMPVWFQRVLLKGLLRVIVGRYEDYGLQHPDHQPFEHHPTVNTELLHYVRHGRVVPHPDIARLHGDSVEFVDGSRQPFDLIIAATGYNVSFPFLSPEVVKWQGGMPQIIGGAVVPDYKNLYFFGLGQPRSGAGPLISEGADLLCLMMKTQPRLRHPIGALLERLGQRPPRSYLVDPNFVLRRIRTGKRFVPRLPRLEAWVMREKRANRGARRYASAEVN
jgi:cation diffusion facilitator CzcD-associated flavoprotein CzcO